MTSITQLINDWNQGDDESLDKLIPKVYDRLRQSAKNALGDFSSGHSLQSTELVNELYCQFKEIKITRCSNSAHFFAIAVFRLKQILRERYRKKMAQKRNHGIRDKAFEIEGLADPDTIFHLLVSTDLIEKFSKIDPQAAHIAELRIFWEFTVSEISNIHEISEDTCNRKWKRAKAWIQSQLQTTKDESLQ